MLLLLVAGLSGTPDADPAQDQPLDSHAETSLDQLQAGMARPLWHLSATSQTGALIASYGQLGFLQFCQDAGLAAEFGLTASDQPGFAFGVSLSYFGALASTAAPSTPLILPGFDALRLGLSGSLLLPDVKNMYGGLVLRAGPHAALAQVQQTRLFHFWLGADLSAGWLFRLDALGLEPGIAGSLQFRKDVGTTSTITLQLRVTLLGEDLPTPATSSPREEPK